MMTPSKLPMRVFKLDPYDGTNYTPVRLCKCAVIILLKGNPFGFNKFFNKKAYQASKT
jgi:hypothetical protein